MHYSQASRRFKICINCAGEGRRNVDEPAAVSNADNQEGIAYLYTCMTSHHVHMAVCVYSLSCRLQGWQHTGSDIVEVPG